MKKLELEIKVIDYKRLLDEKIILSLKDEGINTISFGSNSCYKQLPPQELMDSILENIKTFRIKFIVPILFESHFEKVTNYLDSFIDKIDCLCVNDLGVLNYVSKKHQDKKFKISIGSGLFYSYAQCPWNGHIISNELPKVKTNALKGNFCNEWMIDFLKGFDFQYEFEISASKIIIENSEILQKEQIDINMEIGILPITFSRSCHMLRFNQGSVDNCNRECLKMVKLVSTHRWDFMEGDVKEIRNVIKEQLPGYLVWGNAVYIENKIEDISWATNKIQSLVFDLRYFQSVENIAETIKRFDVEKYTLNTIS